MPDSPYPSDTTEWYKNLLSKTNHVTGAIATFSVFLRHLKGSNTRGNNIRIEAARGHAPADIYHGVLATRELHLLNFSWLSNVDNHDGLSWCSHCWLGSHVWMIWMTHICTLLPWQCLGILHILLSWHNWQYLDWLLINVCNLLTSLGSHLEWLNASVQVWLDLAVFGILCCCGSLAPLTTIAAEANTAGNHHSNN